MADISVERKSASIWPWALGLLVAALLIWTAIELFGSDEGGMAPVGFDAADAEMVTIEARN